jgi:dynein heavy chain, axonemal
MRHLGLHISENRGHAACTPPDSHRDSILGGFQPPSKCCTYDHLLAYAVALPEATEPEIFGLHANAAILKDSQDADLMKSSALLMLGCGLGISGGAEWEAQTLQLAADIKQQVAPLFDLDAVR